jgi:hypothetical protein
VVLFKYIEITNTDNMPERNINLISTMVHSEPMLDNSLVQCSKANLLKDQKSRTMSSINVNKNYEQFVTLEVENGLENETLIPIDYIYKNTTLPLIFVNTCVSGISLQEQHILVKEDIEQVIRYFVDGNVTPNEESVAKFFQSSPGTMIYSPQLVRTIVSLEHCENSNKHLNQLSKNIFSEE